MEMHCCPQSASGAHSVATLEHLRDIQLPSSILPTAPTPVVLTQLLPAAHRGRLPGDSGHIQGWDCSPAPGMVQEDPDPGTPARGAASCPPHPTLGPSEPF